MTTEIKTTKPSEQKEKKKFKFKMPGALMIIFIVIIFVALVSWIPHSHGDALEITISHDGESITYQSGSLGAWQNWIIWNSATSAGYVTEPSFINVSSWASQLEASGKAEEIINNNGLDYSLWTSDGYIASASVPWTLGAYAGGTENMFGFFDTFKAIFGGYFMAWDVALYLIGIYAVVVILQETETLKAGVGSLVKGLNGREILLVPILFLLFSLGGTLFGMQEETLGLLPIIVPVFILAGYDAALGMMVVVIGTTTGIAASVLDPFSVGVMAQGLGEGIGTALLERLLMFIAFTIMGASFCTWYAMRIKKDPNKSAVSDSKEENQKWAEETIGNVNDLKTMTRAQKAALIVFGLVFGWMIFTIMPWIDWFPGLETNPGWIFFSHMFIGGNLIGWWYFVELSIVFIGAAALIGSFFGYGPGKLLGVFKTSFLDMFGVISVIAFSRAISAIMAGTGLTYGLVYGMGAGNLSGDHVIPFTIVWLFIFTLMAFFIPSTSGLAGVTAPIAGGVITASGSHQIMIVGILMAYPLAQGCVNMFTPTGTAVVQAQQSNVSYSKILPWIGGYACALLIIGAFLISIILGLENAFGLYA